jgi:nickel-dependent lactate racemase
MDADLKIGIDTIRSDVFVGATGGRMAILPHSAGMRSISRNLKLQATQPVGPFNLESAVCTDLEEAAKLASLDFIVNAVPDCNDKLHGVFSGNPFSAWQQGVTLAKQLTEIPIHHKADIAFVSAGGSQYDQTLFDAVDALYAGHKATEYGGVIVLVAECENGAGEDGFIRGVSECHSGDDVSLLAETSFEIGMEKARFFWEVLATRKVIICSRMRESLISERFHCHAVKDPKEGYELAKNLLVTSPRVAVIQHGSRSLPVMRSA